MKYKLLCLCLLAAVVLPLAACKTETKAGFGIYLEETGELVLADYHIAIYDWENHTLTLNKRGIDRWNSFHTYSDIPKLHQTLYQKDFIVKVKNEEIYRGRFYSLLSSMSYDGIVILDAVLKLDETRNTIQIDFGYPGSGFGTGDDPRGDARIFNYLEKAGLIAP